MDTITKSIEIDIMEFNHEMALLEDAFVISEYEPNSYFTESTNSTDNFLQKAVKKVTELINKIISKLEEKFSAEKVKAKQEQLKIKYLNDPAKANKMIKIQMDDKVYRVSRSAMECLMKCKTSKEAEKYMEDYKKKWEKIVAGSIVTVSVTAAITYLGTKLSKTKKELKDLESTYQKCVKELKNEISESESVKRIFENERKIHNKNINELNRVKSENEKLKKEMSVKDHKTKSLVSDVKNAADIAKSVASGKMDGTFYSNAVSYKNGNIDAAVEEVRKTKQSVLLTYLDSIISDATKIAAIAGDIKE